MPPAMCPGLSNSAPPVDAPVTVDHIVVAYTPESSGPVPLIYIRHAVILPLRSRAAMHYYFIYSSHIIPSLAL